MKYQMGDSLGGLLFILFILVFAILCLRFVYLAIKRRQIKMTLVTLVGVVTLYVVAILAVSLLSKDRFIQLGSQECFDDWCAIVTSSTQTAAIGDVTAQGKFVIVSVKVINEARGTAQAPDHPQIVLVDSTHTTYFPSSSGQAALASAEGVQPPLGQRLQSGESFATNTVFDVPTDAQQMKALVTEGSGPPMIGDQNSWLHKKTYFQL